MGKLALIGGMIMVYMPACLVRLVYTPPEVFRGQKMDASALAVGKVAAALRDPNEQQTIQQSRAQMAKVAATFDKQGPDLARIEDITVGGGVGPIPARLYSSTPLDEKEADQPKLKPALVYFHGGGFVQGSIQTHNESCKKLAAWSDAIVVSVDYRLAPEHPYPAGVDDAIAAYLWVVENAVSLGIDPAKVGVGGDSAGGSQAAVVAQQVRNAGGPMPAFQVLIYPVTDGHLNAASINELDAAYILPKDRMTWYRDMYRAEFDDFDDPKFSPLHAADFSNLPKTYVLTGGYDPLWDDGKSYADKLASDGVDVVHKHYSGQIHAFVNITKVVPQGTKALQEIARWINKNA